MDWLTHWFWINDKFLGVEWGFWKVLGWTGNVVFFSRFFVQWWATEKTRRVVVPNAFWWLSLSGSLLLLAYSLHHRDSVFIYAYAFTWIPYIRNLIISRRVLREQMYCEGCRAVCPPGAKFCAECGGRLTPLSASAPA